MIGINNRPIKTAGGLKIIPDCTVSEIDISADTVLLLAGADTWHDKKHKDILSLTEKVLLEKWDRCVYVCICGCLKFSRYISNTCITCRIHVSYKIQYY